LDSILSTCLAGLVGLGIGCFKNADTLWEICDDYGWRSVCIHEIERINGTNVLKADTFIYIPDKKYANECYLKRFKK
jgi:hypothetical protein